MEKKKIKQRLTQKLRERHVCTLYRQHFISTLFYFNKDQFSEDFTFLHTTFKDAVAGLLIDRYNELLSKYKIFKKSGFYDLYKNKTIDPDKLLKIKKQTYHKLRDYYNDKIMPILQQLNDDESGMYNVIPIIGFKFKPLKDRSHLII